MKRKFWDGVVDIDDLKDIKKLVLTRIVSRGPTGFQVRALPTNDVVYWSFSRAKVNRFLIKATQTRPLPIEFDDALPGKSLGYDFRCSPTEYLLGTLLLVFLSGVLISTSSDYAMIFCFVGLTIYFFFSILWQRESWLILSDLHRFE